MKKRNFYIKYFMVILVLGYFVVMGQIVQASCCLGDYDENGQVSYDEVDSAINQFLGIEEVQSSYDEYGDGMVNITDLQYIINRHLNGCDSEDRYEDDDTPENSKILMEFVDEGNKLLQMPAYEPFQPHNFHSSDDVDWIKLYAYHGEKQQYVIEVYDVGSDCNPVIELYDEKSLIRPKINIGQKGMNESLFFEQIDRSSDGIYYVKIYHSKSTPYKEGMENYYKVKFKQGNGAPDLPGGVYGIVTPAVSGVVKTNLFGQALILSGGWYFMFRPAGEYSLWVETYGYTYSSYINIGSAQYLRHDIQLQPVHN